MPPSKTARPNAAPWRLLAGRHIVNLRHGAAPKRPAAVRNSVERRWRGMIFDGLKTPSAKTAV